MKTNAEIVIALKAYVECEFKNYSPLTEIRKVYFEEKIKLLEELLTINLN